MITWRVEFAPVREAEPVETPPEAPQTEETPPEPTEVNDNGDTGTDDGESTPEENPDDTQAVTETPGNDNGDSGKDNGESSGTEPPAVTPERPKSNPDYSGLKRTLFSVGLLLTLAAVAYAISFIKKRKGGNQT
jgi:hypothetical protein